MFFVVSLTPLSNPPYTPAIHMPPSVSHIIKSSALKVSLLASRVVKLLPSSKVFTNTLFPLILSASNACSACPYSHKTKFVISTILLIDFTPRLFNLFFNQLGDSLIFTSLISRPTYLGHFSALYISTSIDEDFCPPKKSSFGSSKPNPNSG